jgi:hypothetical protein
MIMGQLLRNWASTGVVRRPVVSVLADDDERAKRLRHFRIVNSSHSR